MLIPKLSQVHLQKTIFHQCMEKQVRTTVSFWKLRKKLWSLGRDLLLICMLIFWLQDVLDEAVEVSYDHLQDSRTTSRSRGGRCCWPWSLPSWRFSSRTELPYSSHSARHHILRELTVFELVLECWDILISGESKPAEETLNKNVKPGYHLRSNR